MGEGVEGYHFKLLLGSRRGDYLSTYGPSVHNDLKTDFGSVHQLSPIIKEGLDTKKKSTEYRELPCLRSVKGAVSLICSVT